MTATNTNAQLPLDPLTGLPNEYFFRDRVRQAIAYATRYGNTLSILVVGIDNLSTVNTTMGRTVGDEVLGVIADRLSDTVRKSDSVSRLAADQFTVLLTNVREAEDAARVAGKLLKAVSEALQIEDRQLHLTASVGISVFPSDGSDAETLIQCAEAAMHEVKRRGKNGLHMYSEQLGLRAAERLEIEADLHRALTDEEFEIYYQPKMDTFSGRVVSAEALIRWNHPDKGMVPPAAFISIAEDTGLIMEIGDWVTSTACREAAGWQQYVTDPITLSVNLSLRQLEQENVIETIMRALVAANLDSELLQVELTESLFLRDPRYVAGVLERFRELGISVAIDDFGTGYSSLSQLSRLPIDTLKIDRTFIEGIPDDPDALILVDAIVQLGRNLSLTVVAEGVETAAHLDFLREIGCHQCQGYFFARPMPANRFRAFLTDRISCESELDPPIWERA
ncbi:MAG: EAL domain-containing protein [Pseudomonadales bacterium]